MKKLKRRPIHEDVKGTLGAIMLGASGGLIPRDQDRLQKIVLALLGRIGRKNPKEALDILGHIQLLTGQERRFPLYAPEQLAPEKGKRFRLMKESNELASELVGSFEAIVLSHIEYGEVPRASHAWRAIISQRDLLTNYLEANPFRIRLKRVDSASGRRDAIRQWLTDNGQKIWRDLYAVPCLCGYRESFDGLFESKDLSRCSGSAFLIDLLLAELHTSTPDAIRKIISHAPHR